jgi:protein-S-isoprenylcysteine O-methyltransferase Ste14
MASQTPLPSLGPHGEGWVAIQSVLLVLIFASGFLGPVVDAPLRWVLFLIGLVPLFFGLGLVAWGFRWQGRQFTTMPRPRANAQLLDDGPYGLIRHPMYGGIVIASFGAALVTASPMTLFFSVLALVFFSVKSRREEAWLEELFPDYPAYRARTRRLIPFLY